VRGSADLRERRPFTGGDAGTPGSFPRPGRRGSFLIQPSGQRERGRRAVRAIEAAIRDINTTLTGLITADELHGLRAGLAAFREVRDRAL
jgi:hypothetical protein